MTWLVMQYMSLIKSNHHHVSAFLEALTSNHGRIVLCHDPVSLIQALVDFFFDL